MALIMSSHNLKTYVGLGSLEIQNDPVSKQAIYKMHEWGYFHWLKKKKKSFLKHKLVIFIFISDPYRVLQLCQQVREVSNKK